MNSSSISRMAAWMAGGVVPGSVVMLAALLSAGCAGRYRVDTQTDADGTTTYTVINNEIATEGGTKYNDGFSERNHHVEKRCFLDLRARETPGVGRTFELVLTYIGTTALNIEPGRSLEIVIGLNSAMLSAGGGAVRKSKDPSTKLVTESLNYPVSPQLLLSMAEAETIQVIVSGEDGEVRGSFDDENLANLRRFVNDYVQ